MLNRQRRAITGTYPGTPIHPLLSEAGLIPAKLLLDFRQKSYAYRLLTLLNHHPTKQILPISLRDGDKSSQSGEQPEDTLLWAESAKPKLLGHLLAQQVASNNAIDPEDGVEPVQSLGPNAGFSGIVIEEKKKAVEEAKKYGTGHAFWVDGSKLRQGNAVAAVCWKEEQRNWKNSSIFLGINKEIIDAELWAIATRLDAARKITLQSPQTAVTIFSDSREAFNTLGQSSVHTANPYLRNQIYQIYQKLSDMERKGKPVTLR